MRPLPRWIRRLSVLLAALLLAAVVPPAPAYAAPSPAIESYPPRVDVAGVLDTLVAQAAGMAGLRVTAVRSRLDGPAAPNATRQAGIGAWEVEVTSEDGRALKLAGQLAYEAVGSRSAASGNEAAASLKGSLLGADTELAIEIASNGRGNNETVAQEAVYHVTLAEGGRSHALTLKRAVQAAPVAYGITRTAARTAIERDGRTIEWTETATTRRFTAAEAEVWSQVTARQLPAGGSAPTISIDQHYFQRGGGGQLALYFDRQDVKVMGERFSLQAPGAVTVSADGTAFDLALVGPDGQLLHLGAARVPGSAAPLPLKVASARAVPQRGGCEAVNMVTGLLTGMGIGIALASIGAILAPELLGGTLFALVYDQLLGSVISITIGTVFSQLQRSHPEWRQELEMWSGLTQVLAAFLGGLNLGGALGALGELVGLYAGGSSGCNADPYFMAPDIRGLPEPEGDGVVEITRTSGGLLAPATVTSTLAAPAAAAPTFAGRPAYEDLPQVFVGGTVPSGATAIGEWQWDAGRPFGAVPSHTQTPTAGTQRHYFIHASQPLTLTADQNIVQYVYVDPKEPPAEIYLQFYTGDGDGEHRAYWGQDLAQTGGTAGTASLYPMGTLPAAGGWVRLKVPADRLGLSGRPVNGLLFGAYGGQTWWGPTTISSRLTDNSPDMLTVPGPDALPDTVPGAQIAFRLPQAARLSLAILGAAGRTVRTLIADETVAAGYRVAVWDGRDDAGQPAPDVPYRARFSNAEGLLAEAPVTLSPFVAAISTPTRNSVVRGANVPVIGEAYGSHFKGYVVEYGEGRAPQSWRTLTDATAPVLRPVAGEALARLYAGNLANWDTGLDEFMPWDRAGLSGVYTLRLRATGDDGREASDSISVFVGRLAHSATGGTIASPDGRARLIIPRLATRDSFVLLALMPASQSDPDGAWQDNLPAGKTLAGEVYEILPADESFRQPAMLELPYAAGSAGARVGVLLGDGTRDGWRYLGGTVDAKRGVVAVAVTEFGPTRALVAPFIADDFGTAQPYRTAPQMLGFDAPSPGPRVTASSAPFAFYDDFAAGPGEWASLDIFGTRLERVAGAAAGLPAGTFALKVARGAGGARLVRVRSTPYDAAQYPILSFDYRLAPGYVPNVLARTGQVWWQLNVGGTLAQTPYYNAIHLPALTADGAWHHFQVDLLGLLAAQSPTAGAFIVDEVALGAFDKSAFMQVTPADSGAPGSAYYVTNFAASRPIAADRIDFTWAAPPGTAFAGYVFSLDREAGTQPDGSPGQEMATTIALPGGAVGGLWYFHVRGRDAAGRWSVTTHFPLIVDRTAPQAGRPNPEPGGAGSPEFIHVPVTDDVGIDPASIRVQLSGVAYRVGAGLVYRPEVGAIWLTPSQLDSPPAPVRNGQAVDVSLSGLTDYAGNALVAPLAWRFTADRPRVAGDRFLQLTKQGGTSPALSPDGSRLAFVANRSGTEKIWVMRADDFAEGASSARLLLPTNDAGCEADPAWSPDGLSLAFVSDAGGSQQVWVAGADGGGARAVTALNGSVASPTWSPDGKTLAFVHEGNIWQIDAVGRRARRLTDYPDRPIRSLCWQPGGSLLAVGFKLYQETIEIYDLARGELRPLTAGGVEREPAWLNAQTLLYTAPAAQGQPDAVWQVGLDGSGAAIIAGSGQPGVGDGQAAAAVDGGAVALVSTRGGNRDIWIQAMLQLARLDVTPTEGAVPGETMQIAYALPADASVTLAVLGVDGAPLRILLDGARQAKGAQAVAGDGKGANGRTLPAGNYTVRLAAQVAGGAALLERFATARVLDPADLGSLSLVVDQWAGQPLVEASPLSVRVYPEGTVVRPAAATDGLATPQFKLPAGRYDLVLTYDSVRRDVTGIEVQAGMATTRTIDLGMGGLRASVLSAPGEPVTGDVWLQVVPTGSTTHSPADYGLRPVSNFVLAPGLYDLTVQFQGSTRSIYGIEVRAGQVTMQDMNLGSGVLHMNVLSWSGRPADRDHLTVQAYPSGTREKAAASALYVNPFDLRLPGGPYDLQLSYDVGMGGGTVVGRIEHWIEGLDILPGQTITREVNLGLGQLTVTILEAAGRPADPAATTFSLIPAGPAQSAAPAQGLYTDRGTFQLPPGIYQVAPVYYGRAFSDLGPAAAVVVVEGQSVDAAVNLHAGRIRVTVEEAPGKRAAKERVAIHAYPAGSRDAAFVSLFAANPGELVVLADKAYDLVVSLDGTLRFTTEGRSVAEGAVLEIVTSANDFK